jgi:prolyl-tRNA editing enzyme YbaK/EbsC (Cys-tRNA(Pro) deacylase)
VPIITIDPVLILQTLEGRMHKTKADQGLLVDISAIQARIVHFDEPVRSVAEASVATGLSADRFVKSLLAIADGRPVLCLVSGSDRLDPQAVARHLQAQAVRLASRREVQEYTGFPAGSVPPFGHVNPLHTLYDVGVPTEGEICFGSGREDALLIITLLELQRVSSPECAAIGMPSP